VSFQVPEDVEPGTALRFPAVQTYTNPGEVRRWIGPEDADSPAPTVTVLEAPPEEGAAEEPASTPAPAAPAPAAEEDEGTDTLSIVALIVGLVALAAGLAALVLSRRRTAVAR
jgi:periplasmic copper chaperone A